MCQIWEGVEVDLTKLGSGVHGGLLSCFSCSGWSGASVMRPFTFGYKPEMNEVLKIFFCHDHGVLALFCYESTLNTAQAMTYINHTILLVSHLCGTGVAFVLL